MESDRHVLQMQMLREPLELFWEGRNFFAGGNMFVYFSLAQVKNQDFRGPDFFVVLDAARRERKSWVVWEEGRGPDLVIEFLSESTAETDKGEKKLIYQDQLKVPEYFWYDPFSGEWAGFALREGFYEPIEPDNRGRLISRKLGLALRQWEGTFTKLDARWLRWETLDGTLLPTGEEMAAAMQQEVQDAQQRIGELETELARYRERFGKTPE